ncbi:MAG: winged helix-turn-helix domain-containing protein [bacterium]|nr:winged helix-turn-helix domain-containing protein [bacterium]
MENLTLVFPPLVSQKETVDDFLAKTKIEAAILDCRSLADLSRESLLQALAAVLGEEARAVAIPTLINKIIEILNKKQDLRAFCRSGLPAGRQACPESNKKRGFWSLRQLADPQNDDCVSPVKKKKPIVLVLKNIQYLLPILDLTLLDLETIRENVGSHLSFIFTTTANLYSERIVGRLKTAPLIFDNIRYAPYGAPPAKPAVSSSTPRRGEHPVPSRHGRDWYWDKKADFSLRQTEIIWNGLSEIERRLLRLVLGGEKEFSSEFAADLTHLLKTGLIEQKKSGYQNKLTRLPEILQTNEEEKLSLRSGRVFLGEESVEEKFSQRQAMVLRLLLRGDGKITSRDEVAEILWPKDAEERYSDWAIDKFIQRLRGKLEELGLNRNSLKTVHKKGFVYQAPKKLSLPLPKINFGGLVFEEIRCDRKNIEFHTKGFRNAGLRQILYKTTPKTKKETTDWLREVSDRLECRYFDIATKKGRLLGHIGLDRINRETKSARVGCFLINPALWPSLGPTIFKFIVAKGKEDLGLRFFWVDIAGSEPRQIGVLERLGFRKSLTGENILFLRGES